jgi:hypothetical protein
MSESGAVLFARYAYAPNELGYCGPAEAATLFELGVTGQLGVAGPNHADIESIARRFSGAWPYAVLLAELAGIADPLDERVMRAYWTGGALLDGVDREAFGVKLLEMIGSQAGHYWTHLTPELLCEAAPTHGFHVFGVYPWTRLLAAGPAEQPLYVLDNCRIRYGQVHSVEDEHVIVRTRRLTWDGCQLGLGQASEERVRFAGHGGRSFVANPLAGDWLALHWDSACERLSPSQLAYLQRCTAWQLRMTNQRLAQERNGAT